jgi:hypothetical protein
LGSGFSSPSARAGKISVTISIARIWRTVRASGILNIAVSKNGMTSGTLEEKI